MSKDHTVGLGNKLFSFAVISDTHLNEDEEQCNSPFAVNQLANRRLRYVIDDLNQRDLTHVVHLGDVVHPVPSMGHLYADSAQQFHDQAQYLKHPLHLIPGNHDVGDKPIAWGPAGTVRDDFLAAWTEHFGAHYFCVEQQDIAFIGINAQLLGSGLMLETEQRDWLEGKLEAVQGKRIFFFTHYPPFLLHANEAEHYDNLGHSGRTWLLALLDKYRVEALFAGHVHHFWYHRYRSCQCYLMPSTAFTRQDYSEMFRAAPADAEFGRNDKAKLGYLVIHVHEQGHYFEMVRCYGQEQREHKTASVGKTKTENARRYPPAVNALNNRFPVLGFDLRQDWMETVQIPPSGGLDEFERKVVRNDYALLALWEMGVKKLRIPLTDLRSAKRRQRLADMRALGFEFTVFSFGIPALDSKHYGHEWHEVCALVTTWEICFPLADVGKFTPELTAFAQTLAQDTRIIFSPLRSKADIVDSGRKYYHVINHGFTLHDHALAGQLQQLKQQPAIKGFTLRCGLFDSVSATVQLASALKQSTNLHPVIHLRMAGDNPAENITAEEQLCQRLEDAMLTAKSSCIDTVFCDTLADNDRGYFPRVGVLDRHYNPKKGFYKIRQLHADLNQ